MQKNEKLQNEIIKMPVRAAPYQHQVDAFNFVCRLFGILEGGDDNISIGNRGSALLMEM